MASQVTQAEYEFECKMATEAGLVSLGKQMLLKTQKLENESKEFTKVVDYLQSDKLDKKHKTTRYIRKYIRLTDLTIEVLTKDKENLKETNDDLNEELDTSTNEVDTLEERLALEKHTFEVEMNVLKKDFLECNAALMESKEKIKFLTTHIITLVTTYIIFFCLIYNNYIIVTLIK